jgi:hypothetical protein
MEEVVVVKLGCRFAVRLRNYWWAEKILQLENMTSREKEIRPP